MIEIFLPLEQAKKITTPEFHNSAFVWACVDGEWKLNFRALFEAHKDSVTEMYSAPTVEEIIKKSAFKIQVGNWDNDNTDFYALTRDNKRGVRMIHADSAVKAAFELWFERQGSITLEALQKNLETLHKEAGAR